MIARYDISSVLDLTGQQTEPPGRPEKYKRHGKKVVRHDLTKMTGIVVHQTACEFGVSPNQIRAAGGDRVLAKHRRALNIAAHVTAFMTGTAVYANPLDWYVYHGNGFNGFCYGLEIEGLYPGLKGNTKTLAGDPKSVTTLTKTTIEAARIGITFLYEHGRQLGSPLEWVYAHRQSSSTRRSDPGEELWYEVVLNYAVPVLGLKVNNNLFLPASNPKHGPGRPIPREWDPAASARF